MTGCATNTGVYTWGGYEDSLYLRYADQNFGQAEQEVQRTLPQPGQRARVPPGVYADYGFLLYRRGDHAGAVSYFEKEKATYRESALLMDKLIARVKEKSGAPQATTPGVATPEPPVPGAGAPPMTGGALAPNISPAPGGPQP